jgi:hypothetical protein
MAVFSHFDRKMAAFAASNPKQKALSYKAKGF